MNRAGRIKRKQEIQAMHQAMLASGLKRMDAIYTLAFKHNLSIEQTYRILRM